MPSNNELDKYSVTDIIHYLVRRSEFIGVIVYANYGPSTITHSPDDRFCVLHSDLLSPKVGW